jgi:hypothetical protein
MVMAIYRSGFVHQLYHITHDCFGGWTRLLGGFPRTHTGSLCISLVTKVPESRQGPASRRWMPLTLRLKTLLTTHFKEDLQ